MKIYYHGSYTQPEVLATRVCYFLVKLSNLFPDSRKHIISDRLN